jgi:hypothetical protein
VSEAVAIPGFPVQLDPDNPWPGLDAFEEEARDYFHGREDEAAELVRRVVEAPLTVLFGRSGLGKTSLLKAGLFPRLRQLQMLPVYIRLDLRTQDLSLTEQMRHSLQSSFQREGVDAPDFAPGETLWEYLHRTGLELWSSQNHLLTPVLVLDQFEELFTLGARMPEAVSRFQVDFADLAENRIPPKPVAALERDESAHVRLDLHRMPYKMLVSLREDFLADLEAWRRVAPGLGRVRVRLLGMLPEQALAAVYQPARHLMDEALAQRIVQFIATAEPTQARSDLPSGDSDELGDEIEPALLSLFCRGLNEQRKREGKARFDQQLLDGAKQGIIADYYRSCLEGMPDEVSRFIESELITEKGFRNSYARDDAVPSHMTEDELERLVNRRLLRLEERYGAQRIELTHDLLSGTVRERRDRRRAEEEKAALAKRAEEERKALENQARRREEQVEAERRVERERRLEAEARAGRRFKWLAALLAAALAVAGAASILAYRQSQEARTQRAKAMEQAAYAVDQKRVAERAREDADAQRQLAEQRLIRITDGIRMKQAVLSGDRDLIRSYLDSDLANKSIRFTAQAKNLGYRNPQGQEVYQFSLFPEPDTLPSGDESVALLTYRMDHPTFHNALLTTGPDRDFKGAYTGWGCLRQVVILIEYVAPDRLPGIATFDMCEAIARK